MGLSRLDGKVHNVMKWLTPSETQTEIRAQRQNVSETHGVKIKCVDCGKKKKWKL